MKLHWDKYKQAYSNDSCEELALDLFNRLHVDVKCRRQAQIFWFFQKYSKFKTLLPYLDSAWKMHGKDMYKQD